MIRIPFSLLPYTVLKRWSKPIQGISENIGKNIPNLKNNLKHANIEASVGEYIGSCLISSFILFVLFLIWLQIILSNALKGENIAFFVVVIAFVLTLFAFMQQIMYPKLLVARRVREIERNLMSALQNILVQTNSGVPLFNSLVNIANSNYGQLSEEFKKAVLKISAGLDEVESIEELARDNPSIFFRRTIWQIVNGLKAGSQINNVLEDVLVSLSEEQLIGIQKYGSQLSPLAMFYMMIAVILPTLGITFIIIISSFLSLGETVTKFIFYGLGGFVLFFQIMFLGIIRSRRPNLMD